MKWKCLKKWTPGNAQPHPVVVADDEPQTVIAHVQHDEHAALIAAAPDMLAALEDVMSDPYFAKASTRYSHARTAIAKARGES